MIKYCEFCANCANRGRKCNSCTVDEPFELICDECGSKEDTLYTVSEDPGEKQYCYGCAVEKVVETIACNEDEADEYISMVD